MKKQGFTLTEMMIASLISVIVIAGVATSLAHVIRTWRETQVTCELNMNLEVAMEHMRNDLRLSSVGIGLMSFYPATGHRYTAISFPMADDSDGDGLLDRDANGRILWTRTVVYHVLGTSPNEFCRTLFSPRKTFASPEALYAQLEKVAKAGSKDAIALAAMSGETCTTRTIFRNLSRLQFYPPSSLFDGYAATREHGSTFNFGSIVLAPGDHTLTFAVKGKNLKSSGFNIEIDSFRLGRARGALEGEVFLPKNSHPRSPLFDYSLSGGSIAVEDMSAFGIEWSGNAQAKFTAGGMGSEVSFKISNDLWCDTNFDEPGSQISSNCSVKWDTSFESIAPYIGDRVISMDKGIAWSASACGDTPYVLPVSGAVNVSSIIYGGGARDDMAISLNGCWTKLRFERPEGYGMHLTGVTLLDSATGTSSPVTFDGGNASVTAYTNGPTLIESDWVEMWKIDRSKSYVVSFSSAPQDAGPWGLSGWENTDGVGLSFVNGALSPFTAGIHSLEVGYPEKAVYRSGVFDTHTDAPVYKKLYWTQIEEFSKGGDLDVRIRSADSPDMSGGNWLQAYPVRDGFFQTNGGNNLGMMARKRYFQYEAEFRCGHSGRIDAHTNAPTAILRDVTTTWDPPLGLVDLEVDFGMGPDCGILEATVDGESFARSLIVELAIYKEGPRGLQTADAKIEIQPLNSGK